MRERDRERLKIYIYTFIYTLYSFDMKVSMQETFISNPLSNPLFTCLFCLFICKCRGPSILNPLLGTKRLTCLLATLYFQRFISLISSNETPSSPSPSPLIVCVPSVCSQGNPTPLSYRAPPGPRETPSGSTGSNRMTGGPPSCTT